MNKHKKILSLVKLLITGVFSWTVFSLLTSVMITFAEWISIVSRVPGLNNTIFHYTLVLIVLSLIIGLIGKKGFFDDILNALK